MSLKIIKTEDGSHSLYNPELKETYHSSHGALTESKHVFIKMGLNFYVEEYVPKEIKIFEVGFGTGLNSLLAWQWAEEHKIKIVYHSIEQYPLEKEVVEEINYGELLGEQEKFTSLHYIEWDIQTELSSFFTLEKINAIWQEYQIGDKYQVIFYDAFAPSKQPEMWEEHLIKKCYKALDTPGILTTYCARGQFKRDLSAAGFEVQTLPGPPGKKEMVRGLRV
ncbi:MAG: tRNA (5-methylaminomethyl-2-thiouridine)(34)-methyltransferase MnmD [Candidatus Cyclobacteriaceae bacterium M2_1C_046]